MYEIFISTKAAKPFTQEEIKQTVEELSIRNSHKGLTGVLIFSKGEFYQILEGEKEILKELFDVVRDDTRHGNVYVIWEGDIEKRGFYNWGLDPSQMSIYGLDTIYAEKTNHISAAQKLMATLSITAGFEFSVVK